MVLGLLPQHQVLICGTYILLQLQHFWNDLQIELANKRSYKASIGSMRLRLQDLQEADRKAQELRQQKADGYKEIDNIFHYQSLPFIPKAIQMELISPHHDDLCNAEVTRPLIT